MRHISILPALLRRWIGPRCSEFVDTVGPPASRQGEKWAETWFLQASPRSPHKNAPTPITTPKITKKIPQAVFAVAEYETFPGRPSLVWTTTTRRGSLGS